MTTNYFLNSIMGNVFKSKTNPALPDNYYIGLSTSEPNIEGGNVSEPPSNGGYSRVLLTELKEPVNGVITNKSSISFNESTSDWGVITHFVIYDAATDGNLLMYDTLTSSRTVESDTVVMIKADSLQLTLANPA